VEILFVFIVLHEFPKVSLLEKVGVVHITYWILVIGAGLWREHLHTYWKRFLATYIPVVYHIIGHIYV
jgi:hypothetical protein